MMRLTKRLTKLLQINMAVPLHEPLHRDTARAWGREGALHRGAANAMRGGLTAEEYRWKLIREFLKE